MTDRKVQPDREDDPSGDGRNTGAGAEAAEGIHSITEREPKDASKGSEPLKHRDAEHKSGYGGEKGKPKTSSDQR
jgi:hypothetical protein